MSKKKQTVDSRKYSRLVVDGLKQTPARAMLRAVGFGDADFSKPQIGIASTWSNLTPCNMHIGELAREAAAGADAAGGKSIVFNTITVSDGISMGSPGMRYSLVSRDTREQDFAHHRQLFLTEQGYSYQIVDGSEVAAQTRLTG